MSTPQAPAVRPTPIPVRLFVIVLAIAIVLTLTIAYLGISGRLDLGIPGEKGPPAHSGTTEVRPGPVGHAGAAVTLRAPGPVAPAYTEPR